MKSSKIDHQSYSSNCGLERSDALSPCSFLHDSSSTERASPGESRRGITSASSSVNPNLLSDRVTQEVKTLQFLLKNNKSLSLDTIKIVSIYSYDLITEFSSDRKKIPRESRKNY